MKKNIIVLTMSTLGGTVQSYRFSYKKDDEKGTKYYSQLEPVSKMILEREGSLDKIIILATKATKTKQEFILESEEKTEKRYSQLIVEGMLLRKYYSSDEVQLAKVIDSFRRLIPDDASPDVLHTVDLLEKDTPSQGNKSQIVFSNADGSYSSSVDLLFDVLYGITLHGDPDRIQRLARWPITAQCLALYESNVERRKGVVTVRQYIDLAIKDGLFALD